MLSVSGPPCRHPPCSSASLPRLPPHVDVVVKLLLQLLPGASVSTLGKSPCVPLFAAPAQPCDPFSVAVAHARDPSSAPEAQARDPFAFSFLSLLCPFSLCCQVSLHDLLFSFANYLDLLCFLLGKLCQFYFFFNFSASHYFICSHEHPSVDICIWLGEFCFHCWASIISQWFKKNHERYLDPALLASIDSGSMGSSFGPSSIIALNMTPLLIG